MKKVSPSSQEKVTIGLISRVRGIKGEVIVYPLTDDLKRFSKIRKIELLLSGEYRTFNIEASSRFKDKILLKLAGINSPEDARKLVGCYLEIKKSQVVPLPQGKYYIFDIVGLKVKTIQGAEIGEIKEVIQYPANDVYVVSHRGRKYDLPATKEIIKEIDLEKGVMVIQPLSGIFDE